MNNRFVQGVHVHVCVVYRKYLYHTLGATIAYKLIMFGFDIYERLETLTYEVKPTAHTNSVEHLAADKRGICRLVNIPMVTVKPQQQQQ